MTTDLVRAQAVRARVSVTDADEAIGVTGGLLVDVGAATDGYVTAMQGALVELGPYIVVAPGVALPHARPQDGAITPGIAVTTLVDPVDFGHDLNDPVDIVVAFSATDKSSHVGLLQQLALVLGDAASLEEIRAATTDDDLARTIRRRLAVVGRETSDASD